MEDRIKIPFPSLLKEFQEYKPDFNTNNIKALRVYRKAIRSGRIGLADRIKEKYNLNFEFKGDHAVAFAYTLLATQK